MCDCIEEMEKKVLEKVIELKSYKKTVKSVSMTGVVFSLGDNLKKRVTTEFRISLDGQKKEPTISVQNSYYQFCGEKIAS